MVVGIAGASGSGKSTVTAELERKLGRDCVVFREDARFFKTPSAPYSRRDPRSEDPDNVDWESTLASLSLEKGKINIVEHFLLAADGLLRLCDLVLYFDVGIDQTARIRCRERRVGRDLSRTDKDIKALRIYYDDHVWPAFLRNTHQPLAALSERKQGPEVISIDATQPLDCVVDEVTEIILKRYSAC